MIVRDLFSDVIATACQSECPGGVRRLLAASAAAVAIRRACERGAIEPAACARIKLGYEVEDTGRRWYLGHHGHMHVSWRDEE